MLEFVYCAYLSLQMVKARVVNVMLDLVGCFRDDFRATTGLTLQENGSVADGGYSAR